MSLERFIAMRYLRPRRENLFVTLIGLISVAGVTVGVMAIIIVLSMLNGFEREVRSRFIGFDAHLKIKHPHETPIENWETMADKLREAKPITGLSPYILEKGMITSESGGHVAFVKGTSESTITEVTDLRHKLVIGSVDFGAQKNSYDGIVVGYSLAVQLDLGPGDTVTVISPVGVTSPFSMPIAKKFIISGIFRTDMFEYDNAYVFISIADAQTLFEMPDAISGFDIRLQDIEQSWDQQRSLSQELGNDWTVETWYDQHSDLYSAMQVEKWGSLVLLSMIIMVAGFNIISTLIMVVMQKTSDIGILKTIGANSKMISRIFVQQGLTVGSIGIVTGCLIGYTLCFLQIHFKLVKLPEDVFFLDAVPMELQWMDFVAIVCVAFGLCLFATFYPARKASALQPIEALKS
ncbi:ABC transporter permease [bacterium]|nr:ABC transporter permease [bacterium]